MNDKQTLRDMLIQKRLALSMAEVHRRSAQLVKTILEHPSYRHAELVALYYPISHEVDLRSLFSLGNRIALPKIYGGEMHFLEIGPATLLETSRFGIKEPINGQVVDDQIDLLLVPSIAIDAKFYRIGYGKGYFDRFLALHHPKTSLGVVYDFQLVKHFDHSDTDIPLDGVLIA